jgi:hypothetical protein
MADHQIQGQSILNVVDRRRAVAGSVGNQAANTATPANYASIAAKRARLNAISATSYTAARLNSMTENDLDYALRLNDDPTSI